MKNVLRWIAVLPCALLASYLCFYLGGALATQFFGSFIYSGNSDPNDFIPIVCRVVANVACGIAWVCVGSVVAPTYKPIVGWILSAIMIIFSIVAIVGIVPNGDNMGIIMISGNLLGAIIGGIITHNSED